MRVHTVHTVLHREVFTLLTPFILFTPFTQFYTGACSQCVQTVHLVLHRGVFAPLCCSVYTTSVHFVHIKCSHHVDIVHMIPHKCMSIHTVFMVLHLVFTFPIFTLVGVHTACVFTLHCLCVHTVHTVHTCRNVRRLATPDHRDFLLAFLVGEVGSGRWKTRVLWHRLLHDALRWRSRNWLVLLRSFWASEPLCPCNWEQVPRWVRFQSGPLSATSWYCVLPYNALPWLVLLWSLWACEPLCTSKSLPVPADCWVTSTLISALVASYPFLHLGYRFPLWNWVSHPS